MSNYAHDESRLLHEALKMLRDALPWIATDIWNDGREAKDGQKQADPVKLCADIKTFLDENEPLDPTRNEPRTCACGLMTCERCRWVDGFDVRVLQARGGPR